MQKNSYHLSGSSPYLSAQYPGKPHLTWALFYLHAVGQRRWLELIGDNMLGSLVLVFSPTDFLQGSHVAEIDSFMLLFCTGTKFMLLFLSPA